MSMLATEKSNDDAKKVYFWHSNKWNATEDILSYQYKLDALQHLSQKRRHYRYITNSVHVCVCEPVCKCVIYSYQLIACTL